MVPVIIRPPKLQKSPEIYRTYYTAWVRPAAVIAAQAPSVTGFAEGVLAVLTEGSLER